MSGNEHKSEYTPNHHADTIKSAENGSHLSHGDKNDDKHQHHHHFFHHHHKEGEHRPSQAEIDNAEFAAARHYDHALKNTHGAGVGFEE